MIKRPHPHRDVCTIVHHCRLVTIPHTGTFFAFDLLPKMGIERDMFTHAHVKQQGEDYWLDYPARTGWMVCTLRDPVMAAISSMNRNERNFSVEGWKMLAAWQGLPNVHFFPVDGPDNQQAVADLAAYLEVEVPAACDWTPHNTSPDVYNLKAERYTPQRDERVAEIITQLADMPTVKALFGAHGYALPWMV